jgi:hypothetical protein
MKFFEWTSLVAHLDKLLKTKKGKKKRKKRGRGALIRPKRIYFSEHFCYCFSSNLCVLNITNMD